MLGKAVHVHAKKACGGVEVGLHPFLTSVLGGVEWVNFAPRNRTPYPLNRRLGKRQCRFGRFGGDNLPLPGLNPEPSVQ